MTEKECMKKYKRIKDVTLEECYIGGKNCGTCAHCKEHDINFHWYEHSYCVRAKKGV